MLICCIVYCLIAPLFVSLISLIVLFACLIAFVCFVVRLVGVTVSCVLVVLAGCQGQMFRLVVFIVWPIVFIVLCICGWLVIWHN